MSGFRNLPLSALVLLALATGSVRAQSQPANAPSLAASARSTAETVWHSATDLAFYALNLIGVEYRFGGNTPESGLDCSGLVRYVFQQVTGVTLPRTSKELSQLGDRVKVQDLQPGDLVFFNTRKFAYSHVGIYLGDDRFIHAASSRSDVKISELSDGYWQKHFNGARRLVGVLPALIPTALAATPEAIAASEGDAPETTP